MTSRIAQRRKAERERERQARKEEKLRKRRAERTERRAKGRGLIPQDVEVRPAYLRMLIVCEGDRTEPYYFKAFEARNGNVVDVRGLGMNTLSLVRRATELRDEGGYVEDGDQVWVVMDRDSFPAEQFNAALALAKNERVKVAWSNEAFELWYLLHFDYHDAALSRKTYKDRLTARLGRPYAKNATDIYSTLKSHQADALRNAARLREHNEGRTPEESNPGTSVDFLVRELNKLHRR
ncbi:MAG: RloB domain-containing protein [Deltaproteobacteria bacterium]|nr:RloB domain-containing protein [Deltaproteobacteria bacterium]